MDLAFYNLKWLICDKTKPNQTKSNHVFQSLYQTFGDCLACTKWYHRQLHFPFLFQNLNIYLSFWFLKFYFVVRRDGKVHYLEGFLSLVTLTRSTRQAIIIIIIIHSLELFTSALADGFSLESEWQQVIIIINRWRNCNSYIETLSLLENF